MASAGIPKVTLKPIVARLDAMEMRARKARKLARIEATKRLFGVRANKLRRAKKCLKALCRAFNI